MKQKGLFSFAAAILAAALLAQCLTGCGGSDQANTTGGGTTSSSVEQTAVTPVETAQTTSESEGQTETSASFGTSAAPSTADTSDISADTGTSTAAQTSETSDTPTTVQAPETTNTPTTTKVPETTAVPETTTTPTTTKASVTTTTPTTTKAPVTTTSPTTTKAPATTTSPTTTKAPVTTTSPTTTKAPVTTTTPTTTKAPIITQAPITTTAPVTTDPGITNPVVPPSPEEALDIVENGRSDYNIIYPADAIQPTRTVYTGLRTQIREAIGYLFAMKTDSQTAGDYEILIGRTNRAASTAAYGKLQENQFSFTLSGKSVVIAAYDDACMKLAIETFVEKYAKDGKLTVNPEEFPVTYACGVNYKTVTVNNTANVKGDDPYVIKHDGYYYYCWSDGGVRVARIDNLNKITKENGKLVFDRHAYGFENVWAPELHYIDGEWYIYVAMCRNTTDNAAHRMYCLKGTTQDPTDPFELVGQVTDSTNKWAIDGTVFRYHDELYTVWSGWEGNSDGCQKLYIAHMRNPWTIDSARVEISTPTTWDGISKNPCSVNEGPCALVVGDTVHILFSGNGSWSDDYCIGMLTFSGGNILSKSSWKKSSSPLLSKSSQCYGPGHCSVVQADDGSYQMLYHANLVSGTGWSGRSVRVQEIIITEQSVRLVKNPALTSELKIAEKYVIGTV